MQSYKKFSVYKKHFAIWAFFCTFAKQNLYLVSQPIITLTADWGLNNYFAGMVKGRLLRNIPDANIVDICLSIDPYDRQQAAFIVSQACREFPQGTIHIVDVDSIARLKNASQQRQPAESEYEEYQHLVAASEGHYYIAANNGILGVALGSRMEKAVMLNTGAGHSSFACFDYYCDAAALLARGVPIEELGQPIATAINEKMPLPSADNTTVNAMVVYIDTYGNAYLNLSYKNFEQIRAGRRFKAVLRHGNISTLCPTYTMGDTSRLVLSVSATGYLQLVMMHRSANQLCGLTKGDIVRFVFRDDE